MGKFKVFAITGIVFLLTVFIVFSWTGIYTANQVNFQQRSLQNVDPNPKSYIMTVDLYFADKEHTTIVAEPRKIPSSDRLEQTMINNLIIGPEKENLSPTIPEGTRLISLDVVNKIAFVNFSREIQLRHWGGTTGELITVTSIVITLTQLEGIEKVQILVEGQRLETLLGHVYIFEPLTVFDIRALIM